MLEPKGRLRGPPNPLLTAELQLWLQGYSARSLKMNPNNLVPRLVRAAYCSVPLG